MDDPPETTALLSGHLLLSIPPDLLFGPLLLVLLLLCSGLISGAEVAFFSLSRNEVDEMSRSGSGSRALAARLLQRPKRLLATILIANNFVNVAIIILATSIISTNIPEHVLGYALFGVIPVIRIIEVFGITAVVLLMGEIIPKVYATSYAAPFASLMAFPLRYLSWAFAWLSVPLIKLTGIIDRRAANLQEQLSVDELSHALELTRPRDRKEMEERSILEGIVQFGRTDVKQVMCPRTDVEAIAEGIPFSQMMAEALDAGYSRLPVYEGSLDRIVGILHVKDLLPHMDKDDSFDWMSLVRPPFFVPESKMIDDLLEEFRQRKVHMAVVVDEFGGCEGIVTLEDIVEEIVGEISDEFDDDEVAYSKLDDRNYVFEGKTNLRQFYRVLQIDGDGFEGAKGEADTLAGFVIEQAGRIPQKNQRITFMGYELTVESVDKRRVKRVKVTLPKHDSAEESVAAPMLAALLIGVTMAISGCTDDPVPKPRGYMRIDLPEKAYSPLGTDCPFTFEMPEYARFSPTVGDAAVPCWFNIEVPQFKATLHFSYKQVKGNLAEYIEDAHTLSSKHIAKATGMDDQLVVRPEARVYGRFLRIDGSGAASPIQLYLTDSSRHFLRGALYFNVVPNNDSLAPVIDFLEADVQRLISTFEWK